LTRLTPDAGQLWFAPLGGCGEIGMNMNLYGHDGHWLMVDCGITFERTAGGETLVQMADPAFIADQCENLCGLVITHAHEDHIGALAYLWPQLECPVYTTRFTAEILQRKLREAGLTNRVPVHIVAPQSRHQIGRFDVEWVDLTHSTPESQALLIRTPLGTVFHTGDWKLDPEPLIGAPYPESHYRAFGGEGIRAMVCDSTNADVPGRSPSEGALHAGLLAAVSQARGRVIVACFGSNIARLHTLAQIAAATKRHAGLLGRSLRNYYSAAVSAELWPDELRFIHSEHLGYLPADEVLAIATGSQGEPRAALDRLASGQHPDLELQPGDTVILSARIIPGNEDAVARLLSRLRHLGLLVIADGDMSQPLHASGHPAQDELQDMYRWVKPQIAIPVHGEPKHLQAHAELTRNIGVPQRLQGLNGDLFLLAPVAGVRRRVVPTGRLQLSARGLQSIAQDCHYGQHTGFPDAANQSPANSSLR